jgi:hypothetical protein
MSARQKTLDAVLSLPQDAFNIKTAPALRLRVAKAVSIGRYQHDLGVTDVITD